MVRVAAPRRPSFRPAHTTRRRTCDWQEAGLSCGLPGDSNSTPESRLSKSSVRVRRRCIRPTRRVRIAGQSSRSRIPHDVLPFLPLIRISEPAKTQELFLSRPGPMVGYDYAMRCHSRVISYSSVSFPSVRSIAPPAYMPGNSGPVSSSFSRSSGSSLPAWTNAPISAGVKLSPSPC